MLDKLKLLQQLLQRNDHDAADDLLASMIVGHEPARPTRGVLVKIDQTCSACPSQWDAWDADGTYYYVRYRYGNLSVDKGEVGGEQIYSQRHGGGLDGAMDTEEMLKLTGFEFEPGEP